MDKEQNVNPTDRPYLEIEDKTQKSMAIAEHVAMNMKGLESDMYAGDTAVLTYAVLHAQNATNQLLVTLFSSINDGFQGLDAFIEDIQKVMRGEPIDYPSFPV